MRKENWTYKKLGEVCEINYGTRVVQKNDKGSTYFVYGGGGPTFMVDRYNREDCFIVARFAMSAQCTRFVKGKFFLNDSGLSVSTKSSDLSQAFVDKALLANNDVIYSMGKGMAQRNLDMPSFRNLLIPVPPLETQFRIVAELDLLQSIIDKQKAQLKELDTLAQAIFYDMFGDPVENEKGWEVKKFGELCAIITDGEHATPRRSESGVYLLSARNIQNHKLDLKDVDYIDTEEYNRIAKRITPQKGDVLISCSGSVGRVCIAPDIKFQMVRSVALLRLIDSVCSVFFEYLICSDYVQNQINNSKVQVAQANLFQGKIRALNAIVPPLSLQQSFAQKVESIERQKELINQSIREAQTLFDSRMEYYFGV